MAEETVSLEAIAQLPGLLRLDDYVIDADLSPSEKLSKLEARLEACSQAHFTIIADAGSFVSTDYGCTWTRILDPEERKTLKTGHSPFRLATGEPGIKYVTGGGILFDPTHGTTLTVGGGAGTGKTLLVVQLLAELLRHERVACLYYTLNQHGIDLKKRFLRFNPGLEPQVVGWKLNERVFEKSLVIISARDAPDITLEKTRNRIHRDIEQMRLCNLSCSIVVVIDGSDLIEMPEEKPHAFRSLIKEVRSRTAGLILIQSSTDERRAENEADFAICMSKRALPNSTDMVTHMEVVKAKSGAHRGLHEYIIENQGIKVIPSLKSLEDGARPLRHVLGRQQAACFNVEAFDYALGNHGTPGLKYGDTLVLDGKPGTGKTNLVGNYLRACLEARREKRVLLVSYRFGEEYVRERFSEFYNRIAFIDARNLSASETLFLIRRHVEQQSRGPLHRAVIFGIGVLDVKEPPEIIHQFLRILKEYFYRLAIAGVLVNWDQTLARDIAQNMVTSVVHISKKHGIIRLKRKNNYPVDEKLGIISYEGDRIKILQLPGTGV